MARMFSEEQIAMANSVDIASFLQMQGEALIKSGKDISASINLVPVK